MATWDLISADLKPNGVYLIECNGTGGLQFTVYEGSSPDKRHVYASCGNTTDVSAANVEQVGDVGEFQTVLTASQNPATTTDPQTEFGEQFISEFQPWVVESFSYALIIGLSMGWAGSFLYRRLRG